MSRVQMMIGENDRTFGKMKSCVQVNRQPGENVLSGCQRRLYAGEVLMGRMPRGGKGMTSVHGESRTEKRCLRRVCLRRGGILTEAASPMLTFMTPSRTVD